MLNRKITMYALALPGVTVLLALTVQSYPETGLITEPVAIPASSSPTSLTEPASEYIGPVFTVVERNPEFPGGTAGLKTFILANLRYPEKARKQKVEGDVYVKYIVKRDGSIAQPQVIKGLGAGCDEEAIRLVKAMPNYKPGSQSGTTVAVHYVQVIRFRLDGSAD